MLHSFFWVRRVKNHILKKQYICKLHLARYSNCDIQFNCNPNVISFMGYCYAHHHDTISSFHRGIHGLKPAQACYSIWNSFASCLFFILCVGRSHVFILPVLFWLNQGDIHTVFMNSGRNIHSTSWSMQLWYRQLIHSTDIAVSINKSHTPLTIFVLKWSQLSLQHLWSVTLCIILWASQAHQPCPSPLSFLWFQGLIGDL